MWFIWCAFVSSIFLYVGISFVLVQSGSANPGILPILSGLLIFLSLISAVMSSLVWLKLLKAPIESGTLDIQTTTGLQRYQTLSIIIWALDETIAVFGLVLVVISGVVYYAIPFCVVSLVLLVLQRPQRSVIQ